MIDWITAVVPCTHVVPIRDGCFQKVNGTGEVEWSSDRRMTVTGSYDSAVTIRSALWLGDCTHVEVSGNLAKFFQGHNLWGTDDAPGLVYEFMRWFALNYGTTADPLVSPNESDIAAWKRGDYVFTRVDVTDSYACGNSRSDVLSWLRAADGHARIRNGGRGVLKESTLYFDQKSRRRTLKLYAKGQEVEANPDHQPALRMLPQARQWAENILRAELTLRAMELKRMGLRMAHSWLAVDGVPFDPLQFLRERLGTMTMTTTRTLPDAVTATLTTSQKLAYSAWLNGEDLRAILPNGSFYRLRGKLLPHGIDVSIVQAKEDRSNVIPMVRILEAKPADVPAWAHGTPLYFEPRRLA